jgi:hypothetical protein
MTIQELIKNIKGFEILNYDNQSITYMVDCRSSEFFLVEKITKIVGSFPTPGSNAFIGNFKSFINPKAIYKKYRLSLNDFQILNKDDIEIRTKKIFDGLNEEIYK